MTKPEGFDMSEEQAVLDFVDALAKLNLFINWGADMGFTNRDGSKIAVMWLCWAYHRGYLRRPMSVDEYVNHLAESVKAGIEILNRIRGLKGRGRRG